MRERPEALLRKKQVLLQEMEHRVANSLQIIASILMIRAHGDVRGDRSGPSRRPPTRHVIGDGQSHLHATDGINEIQVGPYLTQLCESLAASMVADDRPITLRVLADGGKITSAQAASMGLIVTELVINALKYAFPQAQPGSMVMVTYESRGEDWNLGASDNRIGNVVKDVVDADAT